MLSFRHSISLHRALFASRSLVNYLNDKQGNSAKTAKFNSKMRRNLFKLSALSVVLVCICDVTSLSADKGIIDNEVKLSDTSGFPPSILRKFNDIEADNRDIQSKLMRNYMNLSVDPCDDFYEYACGNWERENPIPKDQTENTVFKMMDRNVQYELRELLLQPVSPTEELGAEDKARVYYTACIDEESINRRGKEPLLNYITELGGWPVLDENWSGEGFDWLQLAIKTSLLNHPAILCNNVDEGCKKSKRHTIYLEEARIGADGQFEFLYSNNVEHLDAYRNLIVAVLRLLDVDPKKAEDTAKEIVDFEIQLASIIAFNDSTSTLYNPTTIEDLSKNYPDIDWMTYLSAVLETPLQPNQSVVMLVSTQYYGKLMRILKEVKPSTLANHMVWQSIHPFLSALDENFRAALYTFAEALTGQKESVIRWKDCLEEVNEDIRMATGAIFAQRFFNEDSRNKANDLLSKLREVFRESLLKLDWIDVKTKEMVQKKVSETKLDTGYPEFIMNSAELDKLYSDLQVAPGKNFENTVNLHKYSGRMRRKLFQDQVDMEMWPVTPAGVNGFRQRGRNAIVFPVGILQPPMFHKHFPRALNYGSMGTYMGYKLMYVFDRGSREVDAAGKRIEWFSADAVREFTKKGQCFVEQYANFSMNGVFTGSIETRGENIVDLIAISQAYQEYVNEDGGEDLMPGLKLTSDQLFFLGFAQSFCNAVRPEALVNGLKKDAFTPGKFRVMGVLTNFDKFSEVFQCPAGSVMNPQKKCKLF